MTIDDELIREIIKPERDGTVSKDALIVKKIVHNSRITYKLEESTYYVEHFEGSGIMKKEIVTMTPDIIVTIPREDKQIALELENDYNWDFQESLRQIKKYIHKFPDTRVIIPKEYQRFAPLYKNDGVRVYLWTTKRVWQCLKCRTETVNESTFPPKCSNTKNCKSHSPSEFTLIGLKDTDIEEFL